MELKQQPTAYETVALPLSSVVMLPSTDTDLQVHLCHDDNKALRCATGLDMMQGHQQRAQGWSAVTRYMAQASAM